LIGINYGTGIFSYNIKSGITKLITIKDGLPTSHFSLIDVHGDDIWASHATGISLLKKQKDELRLVKNFGRENGIPKGGITLLKVVDGICNFVVSGKAYAINPIPVINDTIKISMDTTDLDYYTDESKSVSFDCVNFTFANKAKFLYRLLPLDTLWKESIKKEVDLTYILAGNYTFEVKAKHPLQLITPIIRKKINIKERWYNEHYFRGLLVLFFILVLFFLVKIKAISFNKDNIKLWVGTKVQKHFFKEHSNSLNIKDINGIVHLLKMNEILFIKSSGNYLEFHTDIKKYVARMTMSHTVKKFKRWKNFQRVHRSYMVNLDKIEAVDHKFLKIGNVNIPFTERYKEIIDTKLEL
jgi:hypothetical protein